MFIYIVINDTNYPIGSFINIEDARKYRDENIDCKIIKSNLVGDSPSLANKLKDKMGISDMKKSMPDDLKSLFGMKII